MTSLVLSLVLSCGGNPDCPLHRNAHTDKPAPAAPALAQGDVQLRGEKLKGLPPVELSKVLANPADFEGKPIALEGTVRKACEKKGCWMELATSKDGPGVRVTFKDYGFFVPLDAAGSKAKVEGTLKVSQLSPEKAKHLEAEGARVAKDKDGTSREVQLVALGVELRR